MDYDTLANDLHELILHLQLKRVTLIGFSMAGGEIVRYFSKFNGENISKVVLISAITPYMLKTDTNENGVPQEEFDKMITAIQNDRMSFLDEFGKVFFGVDTAVSPISDSSLEFYKILAGVASPKATKECLIAFSSTDFREEMSSITVPTLIIHGKLDKTVPILATSEESAKVIPDNKYIVYEDAAHGLWFTHKEKLNKDLLEFLKA
jgi:pimeloyl-ACP methyl ester carboxylesterase